MTITEYISLHEDCIKEFATIYEQGQINKAYARGKNWTKDKEGKIIEQHRQPYSMPLIPIKLNRLLSEQRNNRFDWKPRGRSAEDEISAEMGSYLLKYIDDYNSLKYSESEVYQDGLTGKYGVMECRIDTTKDIRGEVVLDKIPFNEVCWDTNFKKYNISEDCEFFDRFYWTTRRKLSLQYGLDAKDLEPEDNQENSPARENKVWYSSDKGKDLLKVVKHYERINKTTYVVKNLSSNQDPVEFTSKKEANTYIAEEILKNQLSAKDFQTLTTKKEYWHLTIFCATKILEERDLDYLPYVVFFCFFDDGEFWSIVDLARDPVLMFDRYMQMIDKATAKNIRGNNYGLIEQYLADTETKDLNALTKRLSDGAGIVRFKPTNGAQEAIFPIGTHNDITVEYSLVQKAEDLIEQIFGGNTFQGNNPNTKQTATESKLLESNARIGVFLYLDNLVRWKTMLGELVWRVMGEVYTEERQIRITGESLSEEMKKQMTQLQTYTPSVLRPESYGYVNLGKMPRSIASTKVDIVIDKVEASSTIRLQKYMQLLALNEYMIKTGNDPIPIEVILEYSDIDYTDKQKLIGYEAEQKKQKQAMVEEASRRQNVEQATKILQLPDMNAEQMKSTVNAE